MRRLSISRFTSTARRLLRARLARRARITLGGERSSRGEMGAAKLDAWSPQTDCLRM